MGFEESLRPRLERYRREADETLRHTSAAEDAAGEFSIRFFDGLRYTASLLKEAGFEIEVEMGDGFVRVSLEAGPGAASEAVFGLVRGVAAETDEYLMHEELSRHTLDPAGYSGRVLGWAGTQDEPCQIFAVYADGVWRTRGLFVEKSRGRIDDPDEVLWGFCARALGRLVDLAAPTPGSGRVWKDTPYTLEDFTQGKEPPTRTRWLK